MQPKRVCFPAVLRLIAGCAVGMYTQSGARSIQRTRHGRQWRRSAPRPDARCLVRPAAGRPAYSAGMVASKRRAETCVVLFMRYACDEKGHRGTIRMDPP